MPEEINKKNSFFLQNVYCIMLLMAFPAQAGNFLNVAIYSKI